MYKILLHVGLPKTATTTFQDNVLSYLSEEGIINLVDVTELFSNDLTENDFMLRLSKDRLNVISEERITETDKINYFIFIDRLSRLLSSCRVMTLVSLREPIDFIYSYYVQSYPQVFSLDQSTNTFEKFLTDLISKKDDKKYKMFFFPKLLAFLEEKFGELEICFYEDLVHDEQTYFSKLASLLGVNSELLISKFNQDKKNVKKSTEEGKISRPLRITEIVKVQKVKHANPIVYNILKYLSAFEILRFLEKFVFQKFFKSGVMHKYPSKEDVKDLKKIIMSENIDLCKRFNLSQKKLTYYNYIKSHN